MQILQPSKKIDKEKFLVLAFFEKILTAKTVWLKITLY